MYNNTSYPTGYSGYQYPYGAYGYPGYSYQGQQPGPPGDAYQQQGNWTQSQDGYSTSQQPPPPPPQEPKMEVVQEYQQQKATLTKQREDYVRKAMVLRRELDELKQQKNELNGDERGGRELKHVLKENERLQDEINSKLKAILNVIEMLSSIIKDGRKVSELEANLSEQDKQSRTEKSDNEEQSSVKSGVDHPEKNADKDQKFSLAYYDTGMHWCRACDKFPETAKEFLQHLHSHRHQDRAKESEVDTTPWHKLPVEPLLPTYDDAPIKRVPIKGLQFFISAPSWYCKLCDIWIGDLHCASHHLKSQGHFQNYENFVKQNPHWEAEWLKDREKAMSRKENDDDSSDSEKSRKKKKRRRRDSAESYVKEKKKKKRSKKKKKRSSDTSSSSSSSDSSSDEDEANNTDKGKSIRVAMRNIQQVKSIMDEDMTKWSILEKLMKDVRKKDGDKKDKIDDELISQWMNIANPVPEKEKNLLENLKERMKMKQDLEKAKLLELELRRREKQRESEDDDKKRRQENVDRERKRQDDELQKLLDKDRDHVKFKTSKEQDRKRPSESPVGDKNNHGDRDDSPPIRRRKSSERERSQSRSPEREQAKKKPDYRKLPFIGRIPMLKKKFDHRTAEREREIKTEEYEPRRRTRFESGNLTRAFIPRPDVVCFPVLSSIPPISAPPEPTAVEQVMAPSAPEPNIEPSPPVHEEPPPPPPQMMEHMEQHHVAYSEEAYYQMYQSSGYNTVPAHPPNPVPHPPLEPPPLPPDDDLAMLGICADDMAAQTF